MGEGGGWVIRKVLPSFRVVVFGLSQNSLAFYSVISVFLGVFGWDISCSNQLLTKICISHPPSVQTTKSAFVCYIFCKENTSLNHLCAWSHSPFFTAAHLSCSGQLRSALECGMWLLHKRAYWVNHLMIFIFRFHAREHVKCNSRFTVCFSNAT
jgi:hypothetical protein